MLKKLIVLTVVVLFAAVGCSKGKYSDFKAVMGDLIKSEETFIAAVEKAAVADDIVKAVNGLSDAMANLKPKLTELEKKYPELKDEKNTPAELKTVKDQFEAVNNKFAQSMQTIMTKFGADEKVQKAFQDMMAKAQ